MRFIQSQHIPYINIAELALTHLPDFLERWLPGGRKSGCEYVVRNPLRDDRRPGSFRINVKTGRWADFAINARGGDVISLYAYLTGTRQREAAIALQRELDNMIGGA